MRKFAQETIFLEVEFIYRIGQKNYLLFENSRSIAAIIAPADAQQTSHSRKDLAKFPELGNLSFAVPCRHPIQFHPGSCLSHFKGLD